MSIYTPIITDKETAMLLVSVSGVNLQFCTDELRDNFDVVLEAVSNYGLSLRLASERLQNDSTIVFTACKNDSRAKEFAGDRISNNWDWLSKVWMEPENARRVRRRN